MTDRETRLRVTVLRLSEMLESLERSHETLLPHDPKRFWLDSQAPLEIASQLARELRELLGVEMQKHGPFGEQSSSPPVVHPVSGLEAASAPIAEKE